MTSIWRILYYHNRLKWRSNIWSIASDSLSLSALMFIMQLGMGIQHFYSAVNSALAGAKVIKIDVTGNYVIDPTNVNTNWSLWNPGQQLVITQQSKDMMNVIHFAISTILLAFGIVFFVAGMLASRQRSKFELENRENQYKTMLWKTCTTRWVTKLATTQKLVFSGLTLLFAVLLSVVVMTPLTVYYIDKVIPGMNIFFRLDWHDLAMFGLVLVGQVVSGFGFTRLYIGKFIQQIIGPL